MKRFVLFSAFAVATGCSSGVTFPSSGSSWPQPVVPEFAHQARFAMTVNLDDRVAFVSADAHDPKMFGSMPVGDIPVELEGPHHIAASPDGKYLYVNLSNYVPGSGSGPHGSHGTGTVPGSLIKLDAATGERLGEVLVDRSPGDVITDSTGKYAFVTHYDLLRLQEQLSTGADPTTAYSAVAIVDTESMTRVSLTPVCVTAHGEGLSADEKTLYVTCAQSDQIAVVDITDKLHPVVKQRLAVGPGAGDPGRPVYGPYALMVAPPDGPNAGTVWISDNNSGDVRMYDPVKAQMDDAKAIPVGGVAMFSAFTKDGKTLYVPHQGDDQLTVVDMTTGKSNTMPFPAGACKNVHAFALSPDQQTGVAVCEGDHVTVPGTAVFMTTTPLTVTGFAQIGLFPDGAAWLPPVPQQ